MSVETIETVYKLTDQYTGAGMRIAAVSETLYGKVTKVLRALASPVGILGAAAGGLGLFGLASGAVQAAADFEQLNATLVTLTGSATIAKQKLDFVRQLALPSTLTFKQLADAGTQLEAFGVKMERGLPMIAKLSAAFGVKDKGVIDELSRAIGIIKSGHMPEMEVRGRFGLANQDFEKQGIKFDKGGQMLSSARATFEALERIVDTKYPGILKKMENTTNARLSTLQDRWEEVMRRIGAVIIIHLTPALEMVTNLIERMTKGNKIEVWLNAIANMLNRLRGIAIVLAAVLAGIIAFNMVLGFVTLVKTVFGLAAAFMAAAASAGAFMAFASGFKTALPALIALFVALGVGLYAANTMKNMNKELNKLLGDLKNGGTSPNDPSKPGGLGYNPDLPVDPNSSPFSGDNGPMAQIAQNTRRTADNTAKMIDFRRYALGGGELGAMGVTATEFASFRRGGAETQIVKLEGTSPLEKWFADMYNRYRQAEGRRRI